MQLNKGETSVGRSAMGLASGDNGVKSILKSRYAQASVTCASITDAIKCTNTPREKAVIVIDGNVLLMQVPQHAASFSAYNGIVANAIRVAMANAKIVVVVFDEPSCMTQAKAEEQRRRDAARTKVSVQFSADITPHPTTDAYTLKELHATSDCHVIVRCRPARQRFFDQVAREVLATLKRSINKWAEGGAESVVLFDGLDPLGADRPIGQAREPQIFGSDPEVAALFQREHDIGEGDLKLLWVEQRVETLVRKGKLDVDLNITSTIDTDTLAISLLDEAKRGCDEEERGIKSMLAFRERAQKRDWDDDAKATYWCLDVAMLHHLVQMDMWSLSKNEPTPLESRCGMALMTCGWALAGSDFVRQPGFNASMVFDALPGMIKASPNLVELMAHSWSDDRDDAKKVLPALRRLLLLCAANYAEKKGARKATVEGLRNSECDVLLRGAWTVAYWMGVEHGGALDDFGFSLPSASADAVPAARPVGTNRVMPWEESRVVSRFFEREARQKDSIV